MNPATSMTATSQGTFPARDRRRADERPPDGRGVGRHCAGRSSRLGSGRHEGRAAPLRPGRRRGGRHRPGGGRPHRLERGVRPSRRRCGHHGGARPTRRVDQRPPRPPVVRHQPVRGRRRRPEAAVVTNLSSGRRFEAVRVGVRRSTTSRFTPRPRLLFPPRWSRSRATRRGTSAGTSSAPTGRSPWTCARSPPGASALIDTTSFGHAPWDYLGGLLVCTEAGVAVGGAMRPRHHRRLGPSSCPGHCHARAARRGAGGVVGGVRPRAGEGDPLVGFSGGPENPPGVSASTSASRRWSGVGWCGRLPNYTVGAMCIVERDDGAILFVRHSYRRRWGVPGRPASAS